MARKTDKSAQPAAVATDRSGEADSSTASAADGEPTEDAVPMNRAERRLEAKRKTGRNPSTRDQPQGRGAPGQKMRGRGFQGGAGQTRGTNTRRGG